MPRLPLTEVPPDAVLAEPILDAQGRTLLGAGVTLTHALVRRLGRWNVLEVCIVGAEAGGPPTAPARAASAPGDGGAAPASRWRAAFAAHAEHAEMLCIHRALVRWSEGPASATEPEDSAS